MLRNGLQVNRDTGGPSGAERKTAKAIQVELNRLGCSLGIPDGIVGPNSRKVLRESYNSQGIDFAVSNFRSQLFLRRISSISNTVCF